MFPEEKMSLGASGRVREVKESTVTETGAAWRSESFHTSR